MLIIRQTLPSVLQIKRQGRDLPRPTVKMFAATDVARVEAVYPGIVAEIGTILSSTRSSAIVWQHQPRDWKK